MDEAIRERIRSSACSSSSGEGDVDSAPTNPGEVLELILDGRQFSSIRPQDAEVLRQCSGLLKLSCNQTGLTSIAGLPYLPTLKTLELTDNHISGGLDVLSTCCPNLRKLQLGGNHVKTIEDAKPLSYLAHLEQLGLDMNPVTEMENYRSLMFSLLPNVKVLDSVDRQGNEVECDSDDEDEDYDSEEDEEGDTTLKDFYEKDYGEDDEEDEDEFAPEGEEEDEDVDEDDDDEEDFEMNTDSPANRKSENMEGCEEGGAPEKPKLNEY